MFINDVNKRGEIRKIAIQHLRKYGIKYRDKNSRPSVQVGKYKRFFKVPLQHLEKETVTLTNGQQLVIPKQVYDLCSFIFSKVQTEGLFRKEGSKSRQNEIKLLLDRGCLLGDDHHEIDVAVVLKCFLRELPEPLIPYSYHELFLRCTLIEKKVEAILLACLLLPSEHLNVLTFLMQFWYEVASYSQYNKMNSYNIAILVGPNIFPISEKVAPKNKLMVTRACDIIKLMIDNSKNIGLIPEYIIEQIGNLGTAEVDVVDKVKRRRSGSLTRIFNGLKKIVGNRGDEEILTKTVTPDLLLTPANELKKKSEESNKQHKRRRVKEEADVNRRGGPRTGLERRWSAITQVTSFKKRKTNSLVDLPNNNVNNIAREIEKNSPNADYVQVSKTEYEEIKNRVSAIEKRLSIELENVQSTMVRESSSIKLNSIIQNIQSAYEQTLVQTEPLNFSTDQIAKRLGRELRIRNSEQKMIRSPSARKIGNIRRRSRELDKPNNKNNEDQTVQFLKANSELVRRASSPAQCNFQKTNGNIKKIVEGQAKRTASFHGRYKSTRISCNSSMRVRVGSSDQSTGREASDIFSDFQLVQDDELISPIELKSQKIGIFRNNAILFDGKHDDVSYLNTISAENLTANVVFSSKFEHKIGSVRKSDNKLPHRMKTLKAKENRGVKQNVSPVGRSTNFKQKEKNQEKSFMETKRLGRSNKENDVAVQGNILKTPTRDANRVENYTPKTVPHIKRPIVIKTPKRVCGSSQNSYRNTPLKVLSSSKYFSPNV